MNISRFLFIILFISFPSLAKEATAIVTVNGVVSIPTCVINGSANISTGITQTIDLGLYSASELVSSETNLVDVPLIIDCSGSTGLSGISLRFSELGSYGAVGSKEQGIIKTTLSGVFISLLWQSDNTPVNLSPNFMKEFPNNGSNIYDGSIKVKPLTMPHFSSNTIEKGRYKSGVNVALRYY